MKLETKFDIGDNVYFMQDNKIHVEKIDTIMVTVNDEDEAKDVVTETYTIRGGGIYSLKSSENLFKTKQELLNSL